MDSLYPQVHVLYPHPILFVGMNLTKAKQKSVQTVLKSAPKHKQVQQPIRAEYK